MKSFEGKTSPNFCDNEIPKGFQCIYVSVILIDSVFRLSKIYYPQVFLEECKYVNKEKRHLDILLTM